MNKTLWDYCLKNGWSAHTQGCLYKNKFMLIEDNVKYTFAYSDNIQNINLFTMCQCNVSKNLPLDKQINLLNAFVEAYS